MATIGNVINGSNDIAYLDAQVVFDISGAIPVINVTNASEGPNLQNVIYWFVVYAPDGTPIHMGSAQNPDETGVWTTTQIGDKWPTYYGQIIWSGPPYIFQLFAQDSAGNVYEVDKSANICKPNGNTNLSLDSFGVGNVDVQVVCQQGQVFFQNQTNTSYQGLPGVMLSSLLTMAYPVDETNTFPKPFSLQNFATALAPISYSSSNYQFTYFGIYQYYQQNNVYINIGYRQQERFPVLCNIDLCPLICDITSLMQSLEDGSCTDVAGTNSRLIRINAILNQILVAKTQPLCGFDIPAAIETIKQIGGFTCDCCTPPTAGIQAQTGSVIGGYNFEIISTCGDIGGTVVTSGNNIQFKLNDTSYIFNLSNTIPTTAFTITPSQTGCVKTYSLNVSLQTLATDLLNTINQNGTLKNLFNDIVTPITGQTITVNGGCLWASSATYTYSYTMLGIPASGTFAQLVSIVKGITPQPLNFSFNQTNTSDLQAYLNGLGIGTFTVTNTSGTVVLSSTGNTNVLGQLTYAIGTTQFIAAFSSTATGFTPVTIEFAIQQIVNAFCNLNETDIPLENGYNIPTIVPTPAGGYQAGTIAAGPNTLTTPQSLANFLNSSITALNQIVSYVLGLGGMNCAAMQQIFQANTNQLSSQSVLYGTKLVPAQGQQPATQACAAITPLEFFQYVLKNMDATTQSLFCDAVSVCGEGQTCTPFSNFTVQIVPHNTVCTNIVGIVGNFS